MASQSRFEEEKNKAAACRAEVLRLLLHDESTTRRRLAETLREQADLIMLEVEEGQPLGGEDSFPGFEAPEEHEP